MRVIEENVWKKELSCTGSGNGGKGCKSLLEVEMDDLRYYSGVSGFGAYDRDAAVCFRCPCCNQLTDLPSSEWPHNPQRRLKPYSDQWKITGHDDPAKINTWIVETT